MNSEETVYHVNRVNHANVSTETSEKMSSKESGSKCAEPIPSASNASSATPFFTLWDYLKDELLASDFDALQELKRERVTNFLGIPWAIEKVRES